MERGSAVRATKARQIPRILVPLLCLLLGLLVPRSLRAAEPPGLLRGLLPLATAEAQRVGAASDGVAPPEGDAWKSTRTTALAGPSAYLLYDLGAPHALVAAALQADNDDDYLIEVSDDGQAFRPAWRAPTVPSAGLRTRHARNLSASGRYVRVRATGGDGAYAIGELALFETLPEVFPPAWQRTPGVSLDALARDHAVSFAVALMVAVFLAYRGAPRWWSLALLSLPLLAALPLAWALREVWPFPSREVALMRGLMAAVALATVAREVVPAPRFPVDRRFTLGALALAGVTSVFAFYNLGTPQFRDETSHTSAFAHYPDLRQYQPSARFFAEVGYRGGYEADVAAYAELTGQSLDALAARPIRDLSHPREEVTTVGQRRAAIDARRARFSPARWEAYKQNVAFFRGVVGDAAFLDTMVDFGANATPVWMALAHVLWSGPPSRTAFTVTAFFDLALFAMAFAAIWRAFGLRTMLMAMVVFGANGLVVYGSDWAGATLRHDWLVYLTLGICAVQCKRPSLGGALVAAAAMIRAFPVLAIATAGLPVAWTVLASLRHHRRTQGRWPTLAEVRGQHEATEQFLFAAALTMAALFIASSLVLSVGAWPEWYTKVTGGQIIPHLADVSFSSLVGGTDLDRTAVLWRRWPVVLAGGGLIVGSVVIAARGASLARAVLLGVPLVPTLLNPTAYYAHLVFLMALAVSEKPGPAAPIVWRDAVVWSILLVMCVAQYFTQLLPDQTLHFHFDMALLLTALGAVLVTLASERVAEAGWLKARAPVERAD